MCVFIFSFSSLSVDNGVETGVGIGRSKAAAREAAAKQALKAIDVKFYRDVMKTYSHH